MRPIKFKAKRIDNGEWVEGYYFAIKDLHHWIKSKNSTQKIDPKTLCQFTGLYDKDGKEIWEGDVVYCVDHPSGIASGKYIIKYYGSCFYACGVPLDNYGTEWTEVIGNIHEKEST